MTFVYVVTGSTGEYSDHRAWQVRAFMDEAVAKGMADRLNAWCKERSLNDGPGNSEYEALAWDKKPKPTDDPHFDNDYTGTVYGVLEIPLDETQERSKDGA
jgi:hypothetical protein